MKDPIRRKNEMLSMRRDGIPYPEIAKRFQISVSRVIQIIRPDRYYNQDLVIPGIDIATHRSLIRSGLNTKQKIVAEFRSGGIRGVRQLGRKRISKLKRALKISP